MKEIKQRKERRFLKTLGRVGEILVEQVLIKLGSSIIKKIGGKKTLPSILFLLACLSLFAQYPNTGNKQRLGFQTTADGLVWRGSISDTASIQPINNQNAWVIIDTVNLKLYSFDFTSNVWNLISGAGGGLTMPFDSITFNTAKNGTVGVGEVEYNDSQGSLIQGLKGGNVTNVIGQQLHQRVNNRTGATLAKGTAVYLSGSQGNRITVAKALATSDPTSANTFGIVAESIDNNQSGYVITEGLITNINTSALVEDSAVYLSPTVAGGLTSTKPQAPQHNVYIGVCVKSNAGSGELFVSIKNGLEITELHDVRITSPIDRASLYYRSSDGLWRDTTAALLVSDTASMLANYATKAYADTTGRFYARQEFRNVSSSTLTWTQSDTLVVNDTTSLQVYRNGQILMPNQYTVPTSTSVVIAATSYKAGENYTVIFPRGGGGGGSGSGSLTSISAGTGITVTPNPITTTGVVSADLSVLMELTDTSLLNLTSRFAAKQNDIILTTTGVSGAATLSNDTLNIPQYSGGGSVTNIATGYGITGGAITTTGTLLLDSAVVFSRIRDSIVDVAIGNDTIKILKQEYAPATTSVLTWTVTSKFPIQSKSFILVFRNGQLLINTQYNLTDTNKITIVSNSFKVGANYTVVTVSGIGSVGTGVFPNPVYPEAGIAVSTGTSWTTSIPNNSTNWNIAFNDKINNAAFSGTTTKTLTLTQYDGGTLTAPFTDLQGIVAADTASMLTNYLRTGMAASTYLPLTGGTTNGLITSSFTNTSNYSTSATDNNAFTVYNNTQSTNNIYGGIQFLIGENSGAIPGGPGLAQIYGIRSGGISNPSTDLTFLTKSSISGVLEKMRIKFDGKVGIGTTTPSYLLDVNGQIGSTGFIKSGGTSSQFLKADGSVDNNTYLTTSLASSNYLPLTGGTVTGNTNFVPTTGRVIFGETSPVWDEILGVRPRTTTSLGLGIYSNSASYSGTLFRAQSENPTGSAYMLYEGRGNGGIAKFWVKGDGSSFFAKNMTIGSQTNYDALDVHHDGDHGIRMSYLTAPSTYNFSIKPKQTSENVRYVFSQTNANTFYDSILVFNQGNIGINKLNPSYKLDVNGTLGVSGETTLSNTTSTTPNILLGKNTSTNVVANVTTVAQTGLMTRGVTTFTTSGVTATFDVTHSLGVIPNTIIITSDAITSSSGVFYEIILKTDTVFRVQGFNVSNGSPAINKTLSVNWLAIK